MLRDGIIRPDMVQSCRPVSYKNKVKVHSFIHLSSSCSGRGQEAIESLSSEGLKAMFHQLDINDLNSITTAAAFFKDKYGGVDVLINNAGIAFKGKITALYRGVHWKHTHNNVISILLDKNKT